MAGVLRSTILRGIQASNKIQIASLSRAQVLAADIQIKDKVKEAKLITDKPSSQQQLIIIEGKEDLSLLTGMPEEQTLERQVRIFKPAKNAMQSGTAGIKRWKVEWNTQQRWENNLMGWSSTADPLSNLQLDFATKEEAIAFVEKNNWNYILEDPKERAPKAKSYALNFAWNKRTRKSTK